MADELTKQGLKTIKEMEQELINNASIHDDLRKKLQSQAQEIEQILELAPTDLSTARKSQAKEAQTTQDANMVQAHKAQQTRQNLANTEKNTPVTTAKNAQISNQNQTNLAQSVPAKSNQPQAPIHASNINVAATKQSPPIATTKQTANPSQNTHVAQKASMQSAATNSAAKPTAITSEGIAKNLHLQSLQDIANTTAKQNLESNPNSNINDLKQDTYNQIVKTNTVGKQETWLLLEEFLNLSGLEHNKVEELIKDESIKSKEENGRIYIEASTGTSALIKKVENRLVSIDMSGNALDPVFVEKTIATILGLHDKVVSSKDETISAFKSENSFLKEALVSMQEIYDDDKKTIELLRQQLQKTQEEVEFVKRKYKLMWGRVSNSTT